MPSLLLPSSSVNKGSILVAILVERSPKPALLVTKAMLSVIVLPDEVAPLTNSKSLPSCAVMIFPLNLLPVGFISHLSPPSPTDYLLCPAIPLAKVFSIMSLLITHSMLPPGSLGLYLAHS